MVGASESSDGRPFTSSAQNVQIGGVIQFTFDLSPVKKRRRKRPRPRPRPRPKPDPKPIFYQLSHVFANIQSKDHKVRPD